MIDWVLLTEEAVVFLLRREANPWASFAGIIWLFFSIFLIVCFILTSSKVRLSVRQFAACQSRRPTVNETQTRRASFVIVLPNGAYTPNEDFSTLFGDDLPHQVPDGFDFVDEIGRVSSQRRVLPPCHSMNVNDETEPTTKEEETVITESIYQSFRNVSDSQVRMNSAPSLPYEEPSR